MYDETDYQNEQSAAERRIARDERRDKEVFEDDMERARRRAPVRGVDGICKPCADGRHGQCHGKGVFHRCICFCPQQTAAFVPHAAPVIGQDVPYYSESGYAKAMRKRYHEPRNLMMNTLLSLGFVAGVLLVVWIAVSWGEWR